MLFSLLHHMRIMSVKFERNEIYAAKNGPTDWLTECRAREQFKEEQSPSISSASAAIVPYPFRMVWNE